MSTNRHEHASARGPAPVEIIRDVSFADHERQSHDVYPPKGADGPLPVVVFLHPGAWTRRDKRAVRTMFALDHGFALVSIGYRLAQHAVFPAQVRDVNAGLRHLIDHADDYGIDPARMVIAGTSAGANLAALATLGRRNPDFDPVEGFSPRGVVAIYGAYDAAQMVADRAGAGEDDEDADSPLALLLGAVPASRPDLVRAVSPVTYIAEGAPPFLLFHGREDIVLSWTQSMSFASALAAAGGEVSVKAVPGVGHGDAAFRSPPIADEIVAFITRVTAPDQPCVAR